MPKGDELQILDGPHAGTMTYPSPLPTTLVCMDADYCYHEYTRIQTKYPEYANPPRYRYRGRLGKPAWTTIIQADNIKVADV